MLVSDVQQELRFASPRTVSVVDPHQTCVQILLPLGPDLRIKVLGSLTKELEDLGITGIH